MSVCELGRLIGYVYSFKDKSPPPRSLASIIMLYSLWDLFHQLTLTVSYEPYCYQCYRRESQLEDGAKLSACRYCLLTSFCPSCDQGHPSAECTILQDISADDKIRLNLHRRTGKTSTISFTKLPRKRHISLSSAKDWYDYYTRLSDKSSLKSKMNRDLKYLAKNPQEREFVEYIRCGTNTTTIQLTIIAALETSIPDASTRDSIHLHIIGAAGAEITAVPAIEELLYLLPSLTTLRLTFISLNVSIDPKESQNLHTLQCCTIYTKIEHSMSITT